MITKQKKRKKIIILFCSLGYLLEEAFIPLIKNLHNNYEIILLLGSEFLNDRQLKKINYLYQKKFLTNYFTLPDSNNIFNYYYKLKKFSNEFLNKSSVIYLIGIDDYTLASKYLIRFASKNNIKSITLSLCSNVPLLSKFFRKNNNNFNVENKIQAKWLKVKKKFGQENFFKVIVKILYSRIKYFFIKFIKSFKLGINNFILPLIFFNLPFFKQKLSKECINGDHTDIIIVFNEIEFNAFSKISKKPIYLAKHPAENIQNNFNNINEKSKILVIFSGCLSTEMSYKDQEKWVFNIINIARSNNTNCCDLRLHPRTKKELNWPYLISEELKLKGFEVNINCYVSQSLLDSLSEYSIIIGGPSGALSIASLIRKDIQVFGLSNSQDHDEHDQSWILGGPNNIKWLCTEDQKKVNSILNVNKDFKKKLEIVEILSSL